jgi:phospholipase/carboxylesterase
MSTAAGSDMSLEVIELQSGKNPTASLIVLHGLGADGTDFVPIAQELRLDSIGEVRFLFPHAPVMPVTINNGFEMPAWYDIFTPDLMRHEDAEGIARTELAIEALIAHEVARGIPARRIVLAGFSQGCAMTLHTGLRHPARLAGLIALSGYLPLADMLATERHPANFDTPIFMAHGTADPVVVLGRAEAARDALVALGHPVQWHTYPMPHSVHPREIADISTFLQQVLPAGG